MGAESVMMVMEAVMKQVLLFWIVGLWSAAVRATPALYWNGEAVASVEAFGAIAYNQSVSITVTLDPAAVTDGTLVEVSGGGGNSSSLNVRKRLAVTLKSGALNGVVAGKNGTDVTLGDAALLDTLPERIVRAVLVIDTTTGTNIAPRAIATGGEQRSGSGFNFDNVAGTDWAANAPFDTWSVAEEGVLAVEVFSGTAWSDAEMSSKVVAPVLFWDGAVVPSFSGKTLAYHASFSALVTFDASEVSSGTLFEVKGGGGNDSVKDVYKRVAVTLEEGALEGFVSGKDGNPVLLGDAALLSALPTGEVRAAIAIANTSTGENLTARSQATGGAIRTKDKFNFNNVAGTNWVANAPFDTWSVAEGVTSVELFPNVAWSQEEIAERVLVTSGTSGTESVLEVAEDVTWTEESFEKIRFKGGTLVIPQGVTVQTLRLTDDSGTGTILVEGALVGVDTAEPGIAAFDLPSALTVTVADGGTLQMDGRISASVTVSGAVTLSAATATGVLTLDSVTVQDDATVTIPTGCLEVYACPNLEAETGAAFRRWVAPGYQLRLL